MKKIFAAIKGELRGILHNRKLLISVIGVMVIPLLYSGTYLWAFWDPYGHLDRLPVAVVNNDQGAVYNGQKLQIGKDLVKELQDTKSFDWKFVDEKTADSGLKNQKYYLKIEIPKDFSKNATTLQSAHPQKLNLIYSANDGFNYLASKIGDSAIEKIKEEVANSVTKTYAQSMFKNIKEMGAGLSKAGSGAGELNSGIDTAKTGAVNLAAGIDSAKSGAANLQGGALQVDSGAKKLANNLTVLAANSAAITKGATSSVSGSKQLQNGLNQFGTDLGQMKSGTADLLTGAKQSEAGAVQLANGLENAAAKMPGLQTGSQQLADGTSQLSTLMDQWNQGAQGTEQGAQDVSQGLQQAADLVTQIAASVNDPAQKTQLEELQGELAQLSSGSQNVAAGVNQLSENAVQLKQATDSLTTGASQLNEGQSQFAAGLNQLTGGAKQLESGQEQLTAGLTTFNDKAALAQNGYSQLTFGSSRLTSGLNQLEAGSAQFENGSNQLVQGSKQLAAGTGQLTAGTTSLYSGMSQLTQGSSSLNNGMNGLSSGAKELSNQLNSGSKEASNVKGNNSVYDMFAQPVNLKSEYVNFVPNYGTGFAPYFLSLSLFVGAVVLSVIFPMVNPAVEPKNGLSWFLGKLGILLIVGLAQALLADFVLLNILGLTVKNVPYFIMLSIFTSWTFFAIIQFLVTALDNPGRFLAIIILVLQLTSSAGTYPIQLSPGFLQGIAHFMPMTYSVSGFRAIISTGDFENMWKNIGFESIFFICFLLATWTFFTVKFKSWTRQLTA